MSLVFMYIKEMIGYMMIAFPVYIIARYIYIKIKKKNTYKINEIILGIFVLYIVGLVSQTVIPKWDMGIISETGKFYFDIILSNEITRINFIPFSTIYQYIVDSNSSVDDWNSVSLVNILANIFLFSPLGFFIPLIWKKLDYFKKILFFGICATFLVEIIQLFIGRSTDIDDVILNTIGVIFGYAVYILLKRLLNINELYKVNRTFGH